MSVVVADGALLDFGAYSINFAAFTCAISIKPTSTVRDGDRICGQWGSTAANQSWVLTTHNTNNPWLVIEGGPFKDRYANALSLTSGTVYRIVARYQGFAHGNDIRLFINGVDQALSFVNNGAPDGIASDQNIQMGKTTADAVNGLRGEYAEFAFWNGALSDDACLAMSKGFSPRFFEGLNTPVLYAPLYSTSYLFEIFTNRAVTNTSVTDASQSHPVIFTPRTADIALPFAPAASPVKHLGVGKIGHITRVSEASRRHSSPSSSRYAKRLYGPVR